MKRISLAWAAALAASLAATAAPAQEAGGTVTASADGPADGPYDSGMIKAPHVYRPEGAPQGVVFLISDAAGWAADDETEAQHLVSTGMAVVGLDLPQYLAGLEHPDDDCSYAIADIEEISQRLQQGDGRDYALPVIAGRGDGGGLALALAAQVPASTLAATVVVDPTPGIALKMPLCTEAPREVQGDRTVYGLTPGPLKQAVDVLLTGGVPQPLRDHVAALAADFPEMKVSQSTGTEDGALQQALDSRLDALRKSDGPLDLPVSELPVAKPAFDTMAVFYSGDGGWRDLDYEVGQYLQTAGIPVVGVDSLRYFWSEQTPEQTAADLSRIIAHYKSAWGVSHVVLIGYSFGADILPKSYALLPQAQKDSVRLLSLLALAHQRDYVIHVSGWLGLSSGSDADPADDLKAVPPGIVQCIYGTEDDEDACHDLGGRGYQLEPITGSHHFDGDYQALTDRIVKALKDRL